MAEVIDFDEWMKNFEMPEVVYGASYDPHSGKITKVGPIDKLECDNVAEVDKETALQILEGSIPLNKCFIDLVSNKLAIAEVKNIRKIDDVLHRIIEESWTVDFKPDIVVTPSKKNKELKIELSEELNGSYQIPEKYKPIAKRQIVWSGETQITFLVTDYNDPHVIHDKRTCKIDNLNSTPKIFYDVSFPKDKFSVYTKRIFSNYVVALDEDN